ESTKLTPWRSYCWNALAFVRVKLALSAGLTPYPLSPGSILNPWAVMREPWRPFFFFAARAIRRMLWRSSRGRRRTGGLHESNHLFGRANCGRHAHFVLLRLALARIPLPRTTAPLKGPPRCERRPRHRLWAWGLRVGDR